MDYYSKHQAELMFFSLVGTAVVYTFVIFKNVGRFPLICRFSKSTIFYKGFYSYQFLMLISRFLLIFTGMIFFWVSSKYFMFTL